jgi:Flp pilus assembly protein CpaB
MSRRFRATLFGLLAVACAGLAAVLANDYGSSVARAFGPLRPVVVAGRVLPAGRQIGPGQLSSSLRIRRIPARFVPDDAIADPRQALGRVPAAMLPVGSYLLSAQLRPPRPRRSGQAPPLPGGRRAVEITVSGGEALLAAGGSRRGTRVDVVVTSEPRSPGPGRTYVAAAGVRLLALNRQSPAAPGPGGEWSATLALTRPQALALIEAESFARGVQLLPRPG